MLVGRKEEQKVLREAYEDDRSHFIALYGRRRVGKTFLVRETLGDKFVFSHAGLANADFRQQLASFRESLQEAGLESDTVPKNWMEAFSLLKQLIKTSKKKRKVIFIDELSWMDTRKCDLLTAVESFWNGWASARKDIIFIVCASATSWMLNKVIHNKGGLYNRLTDQIALEPFNLHECEEFLLSKKILMDRHDILEGYMIMGGVPFYWEYLKKGKSLAQNIDLMFFSKHAPLKNEFDYLYASLFRNPEDYIKIVTALASKKAGMSRNELSETTGISNTGTFSKKIEELEKCGFIRIYHEYGKKTRNMTIQLIDNFTLFYFSFLSKGISDPHYWTNNIGTSERKTWTGLAFEHVCLEHLPQILSGLGISGVSTDACTWHCKEDMEKGVNGSQADLMIVRKDRVVNLCEMKYSDSDYAISKAYDEILRHKVSDFMILSGTRYAVHLTLVTTYGLKNNLYSGRIQSVITAADLFEG